MPLGNKGRPWSAAGQLETLDTHSILTDLRPGDGNGEHPPPGDRADSQNKLHPDWLERELRMQQYRRHSIALDDGATFAEHHLGSSDPTQSLHKLKIEQKVSLENLTSLKLAFEEFENGGKRSLDMMNFRQIVRKCLGLRGINDNQIQQLFMKIDYLGNGKLKWDDFCTYMQLEYWEKSESALRSTQVALALPACVRPMCHGEPVLRVQATTDGTIVTVREDGAVYYWGPELQLKKSKTVFQERPVSRKPKWATDFVTMPQYNKLIVGTGDRELQLYEFSSLEPYCQVNALETVPLTLDYCYTGTDECVILYGDSQGCVNIILMTSVGETLRLWKKLPKIENVPNIGLDNAVLSPNVSFIRWKVHDDWVTEVKYFESICAIVSTSNHEPTALVIGCMLPATNLQHLTREMGDVLGEGRPRKAQVSQGSPQPRPSGHQTIFPIYKGVKTFDFSEKHRLLVTGGLDRLIRTWNPYVPGKPTGVLKGHCAPIFYLFISSEDNQIFSVSRDNTVKIWNIYDQSCLFTAHPKASLICGDVSACLYSSSMRALYIATDSMALLTLKTRPQTRGHLTKSHTEPVTCCGYSQEFRQVVSCSEGSVVKVWDFDTGSQVFEFGGAHEFYAITCLTFDPKGRRLVTGGRDGCLKVWNFNNGHCLKIFRNEGKSEEICDCTYVTRNRKSFVMSVGWDRRINIYSDSPEDLRHIQRPQPLWPDDLRCGHKDDILCVAQCPPSLLATGSYDGEVIVWNLVSGHLQCQFDSSLIQDCINPKGTEKSVLSLTFLRKRALGAEFSSAACLVSSGPGGYVHFWNVRSGGKFVGSFEAITKLAVTEKENLLYTADKVGFIYVFNITTYALEPKQVAPNAVTYWRAHTSSITGLQVVDGDRVLLTSSTDCTVRLWSVDGEFIGTFGQNDSWSVHLPSSWRHPRVPNEILVDPSSMPAHCSLQGKLGVSEAITSNTREESVEATDANQEPSSLGKLRHHEPLSDKDIEEEINRHQHPTKQGKRLRHEIFMNANKSLGHGGPKVYHTLKYFEIVNTPAACKRPDLSLAGIDPFIHKAAESP